ncbi:MAG TPA: PAC2 family protein [Actinomycetota bacterium]|nr:PAC2 family protein [Actinomycetota bacterium]
MAIYVLRGGFPELVAPALVAAFDGWIDAAGASTAAAARIAADGETIAEFDPDALYDFRSRRPVLDIVDGTLTELTWPELSLRRARVGQRDVLVLSGAEPDYRWRELGASVLELCLRLGIVEWVSIGSIPAAVPHTRPVPVLATASKPGLLHDEERKGPAGLLRVPAAALSTVELAVSGSGIPAVGFYAQVPHYVGSAYPAASVALLEHVGRHLGVRFDPGELVRAAEVSRERLDQAVAADEESRSYVQRLEALVDQEGPPAGDDLIAEIERFLRQRADGGGEAPPGERPRPDG